jgi:hypothetical protein
MALTRTLLLGTCVNKGRKKGRNYSESRPCAYVRHVAFRDKLPTGSPGVPWGPPLGLFLNPQSVNSPDSSLLSAVGGKSSMLGFDAPQLFQLLL